jgi:PAS domain S-box-containing protein
VAKILIVEDEIITALDIQKHLENMGYTIPSIVHSGKEAVDAAIETRPDLVLMDIRLKGRMDGVETAQRIRNRLDIPVIFLTAYADEQILQRAKVIKPAGYILKPFDERELSSTIEVALYRHQSDKRMRESETHYRIASELMSDFAFCFRVEPDGDLSSEWITDSFTRATGFTPQEAGSRGWLGLVHAQDRDRVTERLQSVLQGKPDTGELRIITKSGDVQYVRVHTRPVWDETEGRVWRIYGAVQDITERKMTEEALRRRNRELALINQVGQELASMLDLDQVLINTLEEVRRMLGVTACSIWLVDPETEEVVCRQAIGAHGELVLNWRLQPGEGIAGWVAQNAESVIVSDTRTDQRHFKNVDRRTGVEMRSILTLPLRIKDSVIGVLQVMDTQAYRFREADQALMQALAAPAAIAIENARLVETLRRRTIELQASNEELDAFAHTVAHDLKTPLGLIIGYAELAEADCDTLSHDELRLFLRKTVQSARKMSSIINELLLLSVVRKLEDVETSRLDMGDVVAQAQQQLSYMIEKHQAEIILPETWPDALGYGPWVEALWVNLLSNAIKYGGEPPRVELGAETQADGMVRFWVRDDGPGIPPEAQARLFKPCTQLDKSRAQGHGLGLSIVQRIAERLGGKADVESEMGRGSTFSFTLPGVK